MNQEVQSATESIVNKLMNAGRNGGKDFEDATFLTVGEPEYEAKALKLVDELVHDLTGVMYMEQVGLKKAGLVCNKNHENKFLLHFGLTAGDKEIQSKTGFTNEKEATYFLHMVVWKNLELCKEFNERVFMTLDERFCKEGSRFDKEAWLEDVNKEIEEARMDCLKWRL